jgi:hypothetical protein
MDKETLSHYGWIVILVLILAVLLALASPFGSLLLVQSSQQQRDFSVSIKLLLVQQESMLTIWYLKTATT